MTDSDRIAPVFLAGALGWRLVAHRAMREEFET